MIQTNIGVETDKENGELILEMRNTKKQVFIVLKVSL